MKLKLVLTLLAAGSITAAAQSQGYQDGIEYFKAGQVDNAKTILDRTLNDNGTDKSLAYYYLGQVELAKGNKAQAKTFFDKGIEANPANAYNYVGLGAIDLLNGVPSTAADYFKKAQGLDKKNYEITVAIARAYYNADKVRYEKEITKFLEKAHKDSKHTEPSIYILEGDMLFDAKDFGGAAGKYEMAISYDDDNPEGFVKYANAYFNVNPNFAISKLEEFLAKKPNSALAQRELAEKYYEGNHWKKAAEQYGRYIQNPNHFPEDKGRYAVLLYAGDNFQSSLDVAQELLRSTPNNFLMQRVQMLDLAALNRNEEGLKAAEDFFAKNAGASFTTLDYTTLAGLQSAMGLDSAAVVTYEKAVVAFPDNIDLLKELSAMYTADKQYNKAADAYCAYVDKLPKPSANDYFTATGRCLNAAATNKDDEARRIADADKGLAYLDKAMATAEPSPVLIQRKARLQLARNANQPDESAIATYAQMVDMLNADPANMDPANPNNQLSLYLEAYQFSYLFYQNSDKEKAADFGAKFNEVKTLMGK